MRGSEANNTTVAGGNSYTAAGIAPQGNVYRAVPHRHLTKLVIASL